MAQSSLRRTREEQELVDLRLEIASVKEQIRALEEYLDVKYNAFSKVYNDAQEK